MSDELIHYTALRKANRERQREWAPDDDDTQSSAPLFRATELGGEVGEALNVVKKLEHERLNMTGSRATKENLAEELADIIICADLLAIEYDIDLAQAVRDKFNATSAKVGLKTRMCAGVGGLM